MIRFLDVFARKCQNATRDRKHQNVTGLLDKNRNRGGEEDFFLIL